LAVRFLAAVRNLLGCTLQYPIYVLFITAKQRQLKIPHMKAAGTELLRLGFVENGLRLRTGSGQCISRSSRPGCVTFLFTSAIVELEGFLHILKILESV
jgi:hypothetical protein